MSTRTLILLSALALMMPCCSSGVTAGPDPVDDVTLEDVQDIQAEGPDDYQNQLGPVIERHEDAYVRERSLFALVSVARRRGELPGIVDTLKQLANDEADDDVRTAAYAQLDLIRHLLPAESRGTLELSIEGEVKQGSQVTLVVRVSSSVDVTQAQVALDYPSFGIEPVGPSPVKVDLQAGVPQEIRFDALLAEPGQYQAAATLFLSHDRVDHEAVSKRVFFSVSQESGDVTQYEY